MERREFLGRGLAAAAVTAYSATASSGAGAGTRAGAGVGPGTGADAGAGVDAGAGRGDVGTGLAFSNRVHIHAHPAVKEKLTWCFSTVLGCGAPMTLHAAGIAEPMLAFRFPGGGSLSVEFTDQALDEQQIKRGAWLEIWSSDVDALKAAILAAGLPQVHFPATNTFYFAIPGGQVLGLVSRANPGAGELRTKP